MRSSGKLRAQVELLGKQQGARGALARSGSGLEEDCKMEVEETDCKKKLDEQKKSLQRQLRDVEKFASKEISKEELQEIERKRTELLPGASEDAEEVPKAAELAGQAEESPQERLRF